jgi:uncharacterized membrane protein YphA (DoxX/SURF4 family)
MQKENLFAWVGLFLRVLLGGLFILSGILKLLDVPAFEKVVREFDAIPEFMVPLFSFCLPAVELACGLCVLTGFFLHEALLFVMLQLIAFIAVIIPNMGSEDLISDCGCFGGLLDSHVGTGLLLRDLFFLCAAVFLYFLPEPSKFLLTLNRNPFRRKEPVLEKAENR